MTRTIKASEVKPGMTIWFDLSGWDVKGTVGTAKVLPRSVWIYTEKCRVMSLELDTPVTVLAEPQPEEPKAFGACVRVDGVGYIRDGVDDGRQYGPWFTPEFIDCSRNHRWEDLTARGQVEVVNPNPFARAEEVHEDTPKTPTVPERIEEWPEDDTALRAYVWADQEDDYWKYDGGQWWWLESLAFGKPVAGPWTRVTDA